MKNYISAHIELSQVPLSIKKTFYLDDILVKDVIEVKDIQEKLVSISPQDENIKIAPFWKDSQNFSDIEDQELQQIIDLEGKILLEYVKTHPSFWISVRETVYDKLREVNNYFKKQWFELVIKIWYRPLEVQKKLFQEIQKYFKNKLPNLSQEAIYKLVCEYVSDGDNFVPPHSTWGAVDVVLIDHLWGEVDMGSPINYPGESSYITYQDISPTQKKNRDFLCDTMLKFWFANLASEWWHFSYGDPIWAYFYGKKESLYNKI